MTREATCFATVSLMHSQRFSQEFSHQSLEFRLRQATKRGLLPEIPNESANEDRFGSESRVSPGLDAIRRDSCSGGSCKT